MGRPKGYKQPDEVKARIAASVSLAHRNRLPIHTERLRERINSPRLIKRLEAIGHGEVEASAVSVQACIALLRKMLPDLATVEHTSKDGVTQLTIITGVVRAEDLANDTKVIEHEPLPHSDPTPTKEQKD